uniref:Reverse transcriptase domain-containing protein n=1 Tax=Peronospora matthiolae TaxID=2874970 RepID=A0AAV1V6Z3_9STRA
MSTIVDVLADAKICAKADPDLQCALALLLDFSKAYDSLSRVVFLAALRKLGFPQINEHVVDATG